MRPFEAKRDQPELERICKDFFGGKDYVPSLAAQYESDPKCDFMLLTSADNDVPLAVANLRSLQPGVAWLEAVRTSTQHRNKGLATQLLQSMIRLAKEKELHQVFTCTVRSNEAMKHVLEKIGMQEVTQIETVHFPSLRSLPGWATDDARVPSQSLLSALEIDHLVSEEARSAKWSPILSELELQEVLTTIKSRGGSGLFPGLYELLSIEGKLGVGIDFRKLSNLTLMSYIDHHGVSVRAGAPPSELAVGVARHFEALLDVDEDQVIGGFLSRLSGNESEYIRQTAEFDGVAPSLITRKRNRSKNAARPGEQVAAKVTRTDENGSWILASVQRFYADTETYDVQDEDDPSKLIRLPWNHVMRLSTGSEGCFNKGARRCNFYVC